MKEERGPDRRRDLVELAASCPADRGNEGPLPSNGRTDSAGGMSRNGVTHLHEGQELARESSTQGEAKMLTACSSAAFVFHQV